MHSVFICYPRSFEAQVTPFRERLEISLRNVLSRDATVFQDIVRSKVANKWQDVIDNVLVEADALIVMMVPTLLDSYECRREISEFSKQTDKPIIPLICEPCPELVTIAGAENQYPANSNDRMKCECASILVSWEQVDFTKLIYKDTSDPEYTKLTADIARDLSRAILKNEAANTVVIQPEPSDRQPIPLRRLMGLGGVTAALIIGSFFTRAHCKVNNEFPLCDTATALPPLTEARLSLKRLLQAAQTGTNTITFDSNTDLLTVAAPVGGTIEPVISFAELGQILQATGGKLSFTSESTGDTCSQIQQTPLELRIDQLYFGEQVAVSIDVVNNDSPAIQKTCATVTTEWKETGIDYAIGLGGTFSAKPEANASIRGAIRRGTRINGPFRVHNTYASWVMVGNYHDPVFTSRVNLRFPEDTQDFNKD